MAVTTERARWSVAAGVAVVLVAGTLQLFQPPPGGEGPVVPTRTAKPIQMARPTDADTVLKDEALIRDLKPLFLPTEFNAALPEPRREPGRTILDDERPHWEFSEGELSIVRGLPPVATLGGQPAERARPTQILDSAPLGLAPAGFGRRQRDLQPLAPRGGFIEVVSVGNGYRILAEPLAVELSPPGNKAWQPLELFAAVDAAGLASPLVVTEGSRVDEVDAHFRRVLTQDYRIGERLPPGFYRVVVGP